MELVDRYVEAIQAHLPRRMRRDVGRELASLLAESIADRIAGGQAPRQAELDALREMGHPRQVASRYAGPRRALIGPDLLPALWTTLGVVFVVLGGLNVLAWVWQVRGQARPLAALLAAIPALGTQLVSHLLEVAGLVLLIFAAVEWLELRGRRDPAAWDPAVLEAAPAGDERVSRWSSLAGAAALSFLLVWTLFFLDGLRAAVSAGQAGPVQVPLVGPGLVRAMPWLVAAFAGSLLVQAGLLVRGRWSLSWRLLDLAARLFGLGVLGVVLAQPEALLAIDAGDAVAAGLEPATAARLAGELSPLLDRLLRLGLIVALAATALGVARRLWRLARRGPRMVGREAQP